jgi:2-polyprenyl-3-methyl-5-hydroxy-6-metoxy-1,4-benzoquinol methylase
MKPLLRLSVTECISDMLAWCSENANWYESYMLGNKERILSDAKFILRNLEPNKIRTIADIGAVPPLLLMLLSNAGYSGLSVIDPHVEPFVQLFSRMKISAYKADLSRLSNLTAIGRRFDLVIMSEVIEHLMSDLCEVLSSVSGIVDKNGYLMITTPNLRSISGLYAIFRCNRGLASKPHESIVDQYKRASSQYGYYGHLREFTALEIIEMADSAGFKLISLKRETDYRRSSRASHRLIKALESSFEPLRLNMKFLFQRIN